MTTLIICTTVIFIAAFIMYLNVKSIAAYVYVKTVCPDPEEHLSKSPYGISRELDSNGKWGYCITKNGEIMYSDDRGKLTAPVYIEFMSALKDMNLLEKIEGYKITKV